MTTLRIWWTRKYRSSWKCKEFQESTVHELLTDFYLDYFLEHPNEALKFESEHGGVVFETGDPLIDRWEQQIAQGLEPDLTEGLSEKEKEYLKNNSDKLSLQKGNIIDPYESNFNKKIFNEIEGMQDLVFEDS